MNLIDKVAEWNSDAHHEVNAAFYISGSELTRIQEGKRWLVIGRKGTGKTALAKYISFTEKVPIIDFSIFRYQTLFGFADSEYADAGKYTEIWLYIIYMSAISVIYDKDRDAIPRDSIALRALDKSLQSSQGWRSRLQRILSSLPNFNLNVSVLGTGGGVGITRPAAAGAGAQLRDVNSRIERDLQIISERYNNKVSVLFDDIDEDSNTKKLDRSEYRLLVSSLLRAVSITKQRFTNLVSTLVFMREDVFFSLPDPNKWLDIRIRMEWSDHRIESLIAEKLRREINIYTLTDDEVLLRLFGTATARIGGGKNKRRIPLFTHIIECSQHRPRDIIGCIKIAAEFLRDNGGAQFLNENSIMETKYKYSTFLTDGIKKELEPIYQNDVEGIYDAVTACGTNNFSYLDLSSNIKRILKVDDRIAYAASADLYRYGIIGNHINNKRIFIFIDPRSSLQIEKPIMVHQSVQKTFSM